MKALLNICSGLDVHKEIIEVCILKGDSSDDVNVVRASFSTLRGDLFKLRDFLVMNDCFHVALVTRIEKFLQIHGFKLSSVVSDITGVTSRKLLHHLADNGSISCTDVASMIDKRIKKSPQEIAYALNGTLSLAERKLLKRMLSFLAIFEC